MENKDVRYIHHETAHNLNDPNIIVPLLLEVLNPQSAIDIGCGIGTFLKVFKEHGIENLIGYDGKWVNREKLRKNVSFDYFIEANFEEKFEIKQRYDLGVCLEVVEHINEESGIKLVEQLANKCKYVVFSCAIPGQMGQNHINEQWPTYWNEKFEQYGYKCYDVFRPIFWNNQNLARWYKQNMFLYTKPENAKLIEGFQKYFDDGFKNYVHPEYYNWRVKDIERLNQNLDKLLTVYNNLMQGKGHLMIYLKLFARYLKNKLIKQKGDE